MTQEDARAAGQGNVDPHLNNLVFSLYNLAKAQARQQGKDDAAKSFIPLEILKMLRQKIGSHLTTDEQRLITNLIEDIDGKKKDEAPPVVEQLSIYEQQSDILAQQSSRYKFSCMVDEAFSEVEIHSTRVQLMLGDLTAHSAEAIVSPDTTDLWMERGVASVIRLKGGDAIRREARQAGSAKIGDVVVTSAGDLAQRYVFHTAVLVPDGDTKQEYITAALKNIFYTAEQKVIKSIALPALGSGTSRFPYSVLAKTMISYIFNYFLTSMQQSPLNLVVMSLFNREAYNYFNEQFQQIAAANALKVTDYS